MSIRNIVSIVLLVGLTVTIPAIFKSIKSDAFVDIRQKLTGNFSGIYRRMEVLKKNFEDEFTPRIKKPLSTYPDEQKLITYFPETFTNFSRSDWDKFWEFIYGIHATDEYGKDFFPKRRRQLTKSELEQALAKEYPTPFSYFQAEHWQEFWKEILKYGE